MVDDQKSSGRAENLVRPIETRYARSGDVRIAYQVVGQGSFDLVFGPGSFPTSTCTASPSRADPMPVLHPFPHRGSQAQRRASDEEIKEAVAMAAIVRHWSTRQTVVQAWDE